jgi:hypothetical protein
VRHAESRLVRTVPATRVYPDGERPEPAVAEPSLPFSLSDEDMERLAALRLNVPVELVELLDDWQLARLRFARWLYVNGRLVG